MKRGAYALIAGLLFGLGLAVSGMTDADTVLNFLDISGQWDPSLALVMASALAVSVPGFAWARRRQRSFNGEPLPPLPAQSISTRLLLGSALFGIGWGIAGYCPGPALASLAGGAPPLLLFVACMFFGWWLAARIPARSDA